MPEMTIPEISIRGAMVGGAIAVVPAAVTTLVATSKIILVQIIANVILRLLSFNQLRITIHNVSLIQVPTLWKISRFSAMVGGVIVLLSVALGLAHEGYRRLRHASGPRGDSTPAPTPSQPPEQPTSQEAAVIPAAATPLDERIAEFDQMKAECGNDPVGQRLQAHCENGKKSAKQLSGLLTAQIANWDARIAARTDPAARARLIVLRDMAAGYAEPYRGVPLS